MEKSLLIKTIIDDRVFNPLVLIDCGREQCVPGKLTKVRGEALKKYSLHIICNGKGMITCEGKTFELSTGDLFLLYPGHGAVHRPDNENPWAYFWVDFIGHYDDTLINLLSLTPQMPYLHIGKSSEIYRIMDNLIAKSEECGGISFGVVGWFYMLIDKLISDYSKSEDVKSVHRKNSIVKDALKFISNNKFTDITVEDISKNLNLNAKYFITVFREVLRISPKQFIIEERMREAYLMLSKGELKVKEIAAAVGYTDALNFSRAFKKNYGISPSALRVKVK